jgi:hypothetical protein
VLYLCLPALHATDESLRNESVRVLFQSQC